MRSFWNFPLAMVFALLSLMMLSGCETSGDGAPVFVSVPPPSAPAELIEPCPDPGVRSGQPALVELARNRQALAVCRNRHGRLVAFVRDLTKEPDGD